MQSMVPVSLVDQFSTVTILALEMPEPNLKVVIDYLRCFPCLEKLNIKVLVAKSFVHPFQKKSHLCIVLLFGFIIHWLFNIFVSFSV